MEAFDLIEKVGLPIASGLIMGYFIFLIMQQMMTGLVNKIKTVECPIVNIHGSLDEAPLDGIHEKQQLVISTKSLDFDNWKKTRVYTS